MRKSRKSNEATTRHICVQLTRVARNGQCEREAQRQLLMSADRQTLMVQSNKILRQALPFKVIDFHIFLFLLHDKRDQNYIASTYTI